MIKTIGFPGRYIQGPQALTCLSGLLHELGLQKPVVIVDAIVGEKILPDTMSLLARHGFSTQKISFPGECTEKVISKLSKEATIHGPDVIIGLGGGKTIDAAKGVARDMGTAIIVCPTIASNDAPTSRLIVLYDEEHKVVGVDYLTRNPDAVVVDTEIIVQAPVRFFAAGIGDAISKRFEAHQCNTSNGLNSFGSPPLHTALMMADMAYATLAKFGHTAYRSVAEQRLNADVERVIEATVLLSGIGFESGGLSLAHALIRGLTAVPTMAGQLHGELVGFGTLVQVLVENRPQAEIDELVDLLCAVNLPVSFAQLGQADDLSAADLNVIVKATMEAAYTRNMNPPLTADRLAKCLVEADRIGQEARIGKNRSH